ncbi:MAG: hypothetical protein QOI95_1929 [Acidimicrobiaceae bacterium]
MMRRNDAAPGTAVDAATPRVLVGLEPLGSDVLVEGEIRELRADELVVATPSLLATGSRAFIVIDDPGQLPIVGLVVILSQRVVIDDVVVESQARFVHLTDENADRLAVLAEKLDRRAV